MATHEQERRLLRLRDFGFNEDIQLGRYNYSHSRNPLLPHAHDDCMEVCYLEKGTQIYETGGTVYTLRGGDIFLTFPGEEHSTAGAPEEKGRLYWLIVPLPGSARTKTAPPFLSLPRKTAAQLSRDLLHLPQRAFHASRSLAKRFGTLLALAEHPDEYTRLRMENELRSLLLDVIDCATDPAQKRMHPGIDRVLRRIEVDFAQSWDNAAMARIAGLSESHFKAMFRKITGNPPAETLARKRVDLAKQLLEQTEDPVTDIAFACGFSSSQYFATVFKRYVGVTPSAHRLKNAQTNSEPSRRKRMRFVLR